MEQKDYKFETVLALLKRPCHARGIAKDIGINHMMVQRKISELSKDNVVDFESQGKNKVYFIKTTSEARICSIMAEQYKMINAVKKYPVLRKIADKLNQDKRVGLAILFGSYANGIPKKDSDIDLYVESKDLSLQKELSLMDSKLSIKIGEYKKDSDLIKEIEANHIIIKGFEQYYERREVSVGAEGKKKD